MRIGIDCRTIHPIAERAGVGNYTLFLVRTLLSIDQKNEYVLFFHSEMNEAAIHDLVGTKINVVVRVFPGRKIPFYDAHIRFARFVAKEKCDIFHSPDGHVPYFYRGPIVITIHDLAIRQHPEWFPESALERFVSTKILLACAIKKAKQIIVPSHATAEDVKVFYCVAKNRLMVIPLAPALSKNSSPVEVGADHYVLFVGTIEPRKNLEQLIQAFRKAREEYKELGEVGLVLAGKRGWKDGGVFDEIKKTNSILGKEAVRYLGYVSPKEKRWLMENASVFAFPSLYEGFGMPVLEAMSLGVPVVTSMSGSLPEVVGDAALSIDPRDEDSFAAALWRGVTDKQMRVELIRAGKERAENFSWGQTARQTVGVYERCCGS